MVMKFASKTGHILLHLAGYCLGSLKEGLGKQSALQGTDILTYLVIKFKLSRYQ